VLNLNLILVVPPGGLEPPTVELKDACRGHCSLTDVDLRSRAAAIEGPDRLAWTGALHNTLSQHAAGCVPEDAISGMGVAVGSAGPGFGGLDFAIA
jgi:hypothetical protein